MGEPASGGLAPVADTAPRLAGGRALPNLLFVTDSAGLAGNIGPAAAATALAMIADAAQLLDVAGHAAPVTAVRAALAAGRHAGVVLVGGYDILPAERVDVLDAGLVQQVPHSRRMADADRFMVWSDDAWGDVDHDGVAELPVSRVPDGRSAALVLAALSAGADPSAGAFGLRNEARPFGDAVYALIDPGGAPPLRCGPTQASQLLPAQVGREHVYFMLHGDDNDAARFWGEKAGTGSLIEAIGIAAIPPAGLDVVFAGCCWGALTVRQQARSRATTLTPRTPAQSMALACLAAGARAFVGCTGSHYSPLDGRDCLGPPMHHAFWTAIRAGLAPAEALAEARAAYLAALPHGCTDPFERGVENKIYQQFTCLGLGW